MKLQIALAGSSVLYHLTRLESALQIVKTDRFFLAPVITDTNELPHNNGQPYFFLSCARSPHSLFFKNAPKHADSVVFVLDGGKLGANYRVKPVSFVSALTGDINKSWGNGDEMEDRVLSTKSSIPALRYLKEIHFSTHNVSSIEFRAFLLTAKTKRIKLFRYANKGDLMRLDRRKAIPLALTKSTHKKSAVSEPQGYKDYTLKSLWRLLKMPKSDESKYVATPNDDEEWARQTLWDDLVVSVSESIVHEITELLETPQPSDLYSQNIVQYMAKNHIKTLAELLNKVHNKWT